MGTKIVFLDIDGVLNHQLFLMERKDKSIHIDVKKIELLNELHKDLDIKYVISSTWRKDYSLEELITIFKSYGFTGKIIDTTPILRFENSVLSVPRGCEIQEWITNNKHILGTNILNWKSYAILDDNSDMLYWHRNNFFLVDSYCGITPNLIYKLKNFLK